MKHQKHLYAIIFGSLMVICGFFFPWFSYPFFEDRPAISGFQMWLGGLPDVIQYTRRISPELFMLLWLLPLAAFLTCVLSVLEMFKPEWENQWIRLTASLSCLLVMGLFLWPDLIIMAPTTTWGLWLCLAGWLCSLFTLCLSIVRKQEEPNATSTEALSLQQPARRRIVRGFVGLAGLSSLGLGGFLWARWTYHQRAIFRRQYLEPRDYQVTGLINETRSSVLQVSWSPDSKRLLIGQLHVAPQSWDTLTGKNTRVYQPADATAGIWSPDGRYIAFSDSISGGLFSSSSASAPTLVVIIDAVTGAQKATFTQQATGQIEAVAGIAWSPDGQYLALGDRVAPLIQLWNPFTGKIDKTYTVHTPTNSDISGIRDLAWSPDGRYLAAAVPDGSLLPDGSLENFRLTSTNLLGVYIWHVQSGDLLFHYPQAALRADPGEQSASYRHNRSGISSPLW